MADDIVLLQNSPKGMQDKTTEVAEEAKEIGLTIQVATTEIMTVGNQLTT